MAWLPWLQSLITFRKDTGSDLIVPRLTADGRIKVEIMDSVVGGSVKSGKLIPGDFSGNPKKASVAFSLAYDDANYTITLSVLGANDFTFAPFYESKTASGFDVNLGANNISNLVEVSWQTMVIGE